MTHLENYAHLIDQIFGSGNVTFNVTGNQTNYIIGALAKTSIYNTFANNFKARLIRLNELYRNDSSFLKEILVQVNQIASRKNWEGAFAELTTFDFLNRDRNGDPCLSYPIKPNITLRVAESLAGNMGKKDANLDGFIEDHNIFFDVKCLKDNVSEILEGIYSDLSKHLRVKNLNVLAEYRTDCSYEEFQKHRTALLDELKAQVNTDAKTTTVSSKIINGLVYRLKWEAGINQVVREHDPYKHALNLHSGIFNYTNKLLKDKPTIIVLVQFPWYNLSISHFINAHLAFYRSFARRVFCQYRHSTKPFRAYNSTYKGDETLYEVSRHISAILFLEDKTIDGKCAAETNVDCYSFINPNAKNPISLMGRSYILEMTNALYDDFECDNY